MSQHDVIELAQRLNRRQTLVRGARLAVRLIAVAGGLGLVAATVVRSWIPTLPLGALFGGLALAAIAALGWLWWRTRPNPARLLSLADRQVEGEEQLSTTYELETEQPRHPFLPLLRARCAALVPRVSVERLVPLAVRRADVASLAVLLLGAGLYLLPASLLVVSPGPGSFADSRVGAEGRMLERLADQLEEIALRERYEAVEYLADEIREESEAFQQLPLTSEEAAGRLDYLAGLADLLESMGERPIERTYENVPGFGSEPSAPPDTERISDEGMGDAPSGRVRGDTDGSAGSPTNRQDGEEGGPGGEEGAGGGEGPGGEDGDQAQNDRDLPEPGSASERALLESAKRTLEQEAERMRRESLAEQNQSAGEQEEGASGDDPLNPDAVGAGGYAQSSDWTSAEEMGWEEPPHANPGESGALGEASSQGPAKPPEETGYKDARLEGMDAEAKSQVIWVQERPKGKMREVQAEGGVPDFQQRTTAAQEKAEVPHAYRSMVRSYFLNLERLGGNGR